MEWWAWFLGSFGTLLVGATISLVVQSRPKLANAIGASAAVLGCGLGLTPAVLKLLSQTSGAPFRAVWPVPYGSIYLELDCLSALFLTPILFVSGLSAIYGAKYMLSFVGKKKIGVSWFFFDAMIVAIMIVLVARNAVLFLVAWEIMSLGSYFLVTFEHEDERVREAGRVYLVATHLGTACLLAFFALLCGDAPTMDFPSGGGAPDPRTAGLLFLLALLGFGAKAGLMPLHVWCPVAYPAAPHHVTAVMSAAMGKVGVYGLCRTLALLGPAQQWWGWLLITMGVLSAVGGILYALAQRDLKRLLAYSSVENVGVIALGLGLGVLGTMDPDRHELAVIGFAGALLHVANHSLCKGLMFLVAGAVQHVTGTRDMGELGGLAKRVPWTAGAFLFGSLAMSGLPPLNLFMSEYLIYLAAFREEISFGATLAAPALAVIGGLAFAGGLAAACFLKAFGITFLGTPRGERALLAPSTGMLMRVPMLILAASCLLAGYGAPRVTRLLAPAISELVHGESTKDVRAYLDPITVTHSRIVAMMALLAAILAVLAFLRWRLLANREVTISGTWGCGYAQPTPRMQYSGSSFVQPITKLLSAAILKRRRLRPPEGYFPASASLSTDAVDPWHDRLYRPLLEGLSFVFFKLRWLQHGRVHIYVLYIAATLLFLLVWRIGFDRS